MMTKREKDLLKKIEELEARIKLLESRPSGETHHHYHYQQPQYPSHPQPLTPYVIGSPLIGSPQFGYTVGCGTGNLATYGPDH
jgi:hypothetical protein